MVAEVFDPCFIQTLTLGPSNELLASTVRTSREIVHLSGSNAMGAPVGKTLPVTVTEDTTRYGDLVKVYGTISANGHTVEIFCRQLKFHSRDGKTGIDVSGLPGKNGDTIGLQGAREVSSR